MLYLIALAFGVFSGGVIASAVMALRVMRGRVEIDGRVYVCYDDGPVKR